MITTINTWLSPRQIADEIGSEDNSARMFATLLSTPVRAAYVYYVLAPIYRAAIEAQMRHDISPGQHLDEVVDRAARLVSRGTGLCPAAKAIVAIGDESIETAIDAARLADHGPTIGAARLRRESVTRAIDDALGRIAR